PEQRASAQFEASGDLLAAALQADLHDSLRLSAPLLAAGQINAVLERIRHAISGAGTRHRVTWWTAPADLTIYWRLSADIQLGINTRLAY
ncbi:MAG: hypothetical protein GYB68_08875, partial [Chloroflexi bacterium]|nr:hypothetical protein [Chloroflexota bacterium]